MPEVGNQGGDWAQPSDGKQKGARERLFARRWPGQAWAGTSLIAFMERRTRPFSSASERLQTLARTVTTFQGDAERLALALTANSQDAAAMTEQVLKEYERYA